MEENFVYSIGIFNERKYKEGYVGLDVYDLNLDLYGVFISKELAQKEVDQLNEHYKDKPYTVISIPLKK